MLSISITAWHSCRNKNKQVWSGFLSRLCRCRSHYNTHSHRRSPPNILAYLVILCFEKQRPKKITVARRKSNILALPKFFAPPQNFGLATPLSFVSKKYPTLCRKSIHRQLNSIPLKKTKDHYIVFKLLPLLEMLCFNTPWTTCCLKLCSY